jgi:LysM repeat protein
LSRVTTKLKDFNMSNPFGLPKVLVAEREARRRQRFRLGVYSVLIGTTVLITGTLIQGCRSQQKASAETVVEKPVLAGNDNSANPSTNLPPIPQPPPESATETNCVTPGSASLPENVTVPVPVPTPVSHAVHAHSSSPVKASHKTASVHGSAGVYVVKSGDTLVRIAKAHGIAVNALKSANHLKSDRIFAGEKLKMPQANLAAAKVAKN